ARRPLRATGTGAATVDRTRRGTWAFGRPGRPLVSPPARWPGPGWAAGRPHRTRWGGPAPGATRPGPGTVRPTAPRPAGPMALRCHRRTAPPAHPPGRTVRESAP